MTRAAAFLDRDGTILEEAHYLADPDDVVLIPGVVAAIRSLCDAGLAVVVVTNQSGIARGKYTVSDYEAVAARLDRILEAEGVRFDATYYCPCHPDISGPCDCRKPKTGMYETASQELGLDLRSSFYVGDKASDVQPGLALGGRSFLVRTGYGRAHEPEVPDGVEVVDDLPAAAAKIVASRRR
ncbi:MAG: HAD-IIIA family hydrolase [Gemmatimonadota bacterium]